MQTGRRGENIAREFLVKAGYTILEQNWRCGRIEIDIIARQNNTIVFVEVKTRSSRWVADPAQSVDPEKESRISYAAVSYLDMINHEWTFRFDIISILLLPGRRPEIEHFPDAFFPGME